MWWDNADLAANTKAQSTTKIGYISEICRFAVWIEKYMNNSGIKWKLNDLLDFNNIKGDKLNFNHGSKFFVDPTKYLSEKE